VIEQALLAKVPLRDISRQCRVSKDALSRHVPHISPAAIESKAELDAGRARTLTEEIARLQADAHRICAGAEKEGDKRTALMAIRELVRIADLLARIGGHVQDAGGKSTVVVQVQYIERAVIPSVAPMLDSEED
jgi:hypothetical protein